jgi:LmbE family N-acetylglucosaminyl deacetylase
MEPARLLDPPPGRVLVLAPHPDDETCGLGGTLRLHRNNGDKVTVLFVTDGRNGDPEFRFGEDLVEIRKREALAAAEVLGGLETAFLGFPDNMEASEQDLMMVAGKIEKWVGRVQPDLVYVPWVEDAHMDHKNTRLALDGMAQPSKLFRLLEYELWAPLPADYVVDITEVADVKREAIGCYPSQTAYTDYRHHIMGLNAHRAAFLVGRGRFAEGFREGRLGEFR